MADLDEDNAVNEEVVSITEYMDGMAAQEMEADMVLGVDEGKECTYEKGYMRRQAIFSCLTCTPDGNAGFCTACSLACHDGHEKVIELWTRRNFRCDCGNAKFGLMECKLFKDKEPQNDANVYNQNYRGVYCTCHRPYPDPGSEDLGEMLQCCVCEDWFHEAHFGLLPSQQVPRDDEGDPTFDELICPSCATTRCSFLHQYPKLLIPPADVQEADEDPVTPSDAVKGGPSSFSVENGNEVVAPPSLPIENGNEVVAPPSLPIENGNEAVAHDPSPLVNSGESSEASNRNGCSSRSRTESPTEGKLESSVTASSHTGSSRASGDGKMICKLMQATRAEASQLRATGTSDVTVGGGGMVDRQGAEAEAGQALFMAKSWRAELCRCDDCLALYKEKGVEFLLDGKDTLQEYEEAAKRKREEVQEQQAGTALDFMTNLGHVQKIELARGLNDLATELGSFLTPFGEEGKTVTSADITEFFDKMQQKRRRRT